MLLGLRTVIYTVDDLDQAKAWYRKAFGIEPYFDEPFYVGFNVGGFELGLDPDTTEAKRGNTPIAYWGVADIGASHKRILEAGGKPNDAIKAVGEGIKVASIFDPFGNVVGLIENPHFKLPA